MPYITVEEVKAIRSELKSQFPEIKFSVTRDNSSGVSVSILESPYTWSSDYHAINQFYLEDYPNADVLKQIYQIASKNQRTLVHDQDYGAVPTYYINLQIGQWHKPHKQTT